MNTWRAVIVDDERLARNKLRALLAAHPEIQIVAEADSATTALQAVRDAHPDIIFLDIQMPGASGFELANQLPAEVRVIFVTAFDEYALRAFEINALDYLLKPVSPTRLADSLARLTRNDPAQPPPNRLLEYDDHLFLNLGDSAKFIRISSIKCIYAADVYSQVLTTEGQKILVLKPLSEWEARLPAKHFARIHRSAIINMAFVERVEKWFGYSFQIYLRDLSEPLTLSRRYAARLKDRLG